MKDQFDAIEQRAADILRMTEAELIAKCEPPMSFPTYWRARTGVTKRRSTMVRILRRMEETLERLIKEKGE